MGTDANEKSGRNAKKTTFKYVRIGLILAAAFCVWSQANTTLTDLGSGLAETAEAVLEQGTRTLNQAVWTEEDQDEHYGSSDQGHALEKAQLKALADKANADAAIAKMEAEKLKLEVAKAKMDAEKARAQAEKALLNEKAAKENAEMHAKTAEKEKQLAKEALAQTKAMEEAQAKKARDEEEAAKKAALQAKIAAKKAERAEKEGAADAAAKAKKEAMLAQRASAENKLEEGVAAVDETVEEETPAEETEEEKKASSKKRLEAKIAARQAARAEKEAAKKAKNEKENLNEEVTMNEEETEEVAEETKKDAVVATKETAEDETPAEETEEEKKANYKQKLEAKIDAKQAARAEKEAAKKAKKEQENLKTAEEENPAEETEEEKLQAKVAANQAARAEKEAVRRAKRRQEKQNEETAMNEEQPEEAKEAVIVAEETVVEETEEEKKANYKKRLEAKIAAKQAARAEKEAAKEAKKEQEEVEKEAKPLVVPPGPIDENHDATIREWGCARNETPFIFVHIGKAGGGGVRSRMAASALHYNRSGWHRVHEDPSYYYPIYDEQGQLHKGTFASSRMNNWVPKNFSQVEKDFEYEGFGPCAATTPLGQALSCPMPSEHCGNDTGSSRCDLVYMGHNVLGSELHWLPTQYLVNWWKSTSWGRKKDDFIKHMLKDRFNGGGGDFGEWQQHLKPRRLMKYQYPDLVCPPGPLQYREFKRHYDKCTAPKEPWMDEVTQFETGSDPVIFGAKVISSMPVMRVTVLREPFSWLTSKFFWHPFHVGIDDKQVSPDSGQKKNDLLVKERLKKKKDHPNFIKCDDMDQAANGWASYRALTYIFYLCGEHCMGGYVKGVMTIDDLERQAAYNLRNSFAVVGLLHKTDDFYDMVSRRVNYMDMSLNPDVKGKQHSSGTHAEALRCKEVYKDPDFKNRMMAKSPAVAALYRLYLVAVEVNEFQESELAKCAET